MSSLSYYEQRGTLTYMVGIEPHTMQGHFSITGQGVIARKVGGRNRWHLCAGRDVVSFIRRAPF